MKVSFPISASFLKNKVWQYKAIASLIKFKFNFVLFTSLVSMYVRNLYVSSENNNLKFTKLK